MDGGDSRKRQRSESNTIEDVEEGQILKRYKEEGEESSLSESESPRPSPPNAPMHPSQLHANSPTSIANTPSTPFTADTPEASSHSPYPDRASERIFTGCSAYEDYAPIKKIGEGTFGEVVCATQKKTGKIYALKKILMHNEKEGVNAILLISQMPITALREIKILKALDHENVISLFEIAFQRGDRKTRARGSIYMVFPYLDHDLSGLLENDRVRLSSAQIKSYFQQLLRATEYLHQNKILHRDMKSANILIDNKGYLKLADFGLARSYTPEQPQRDYTNCVITRWYRPPELLMGATKYDGAVDYWGVGCVFGEMLKRRPILTGTTDLDQLEKIFALCGEPNEAYWPGFKSYPSFSTTVETIKRKHLRTLKEKFASCTKNEISLLDAFLQTNPAKRISPAKALLHVYFTSHPLPARPNTRDFDIFPTSHEYDTRKAKNEEAKHRNANGDSRKTQKRAGGYDGSGRV